jgi:hypothetical protein
VGNCSSNLNLLCREAALPAFYLILTQIFLKLRGKHARVRKLRKDQWEQAWAKCKDAQRLKTMEGLNALVAAGLLIVAGDAQGRHMYRNGELVYKLSEKGERLAKHDNNK